MEVSLAQFGKVVFFLPAGLLVYLSREWVVNGVNRKFASVEIVNPLMKIDLLALTAFSLSGLAWGGFCQRGRRESVLAFIVAQLWFLAIISIVLFYAQVNTLTPHTFLSTFLSFMITISWAGFLLNFIPLPPFDASFFYIPALYSLTFTEVFITFVKIALVVWFVLIQEIPSFLHGDFLLRWAGLQ